VRAAGAIVVAYLLFAEILARMTIERGFDFTLITLLVLVLRLTTIFIVPAIVVHRGINLARTTAPRCRW
jgi:hypothetical protein